MEHHVLNRFRHSFYPHKATTLLIKLEWDWKKFYDRVYDGIIAFGPRIIVAIVVFLLGLWAIRLVNKWLKKSFEKRRRFNPSLRYFLQNLLAISLQVLLVFLVWQVAGIQLTFLQRLLRV